MPTLSILIPSTHCRNGMLKGLLKTMGVDAVINNDITVFKLKYLEIIINVDSKEKTTGKKRNELIEAAKGKYFVFVDSDDYISPEYIPLILAAAETNPDVICFNGWMTTKGADRKDFEFNLHNPYAAITKNGKTIYLRFPNHLCPMKKELVKDFKFQDISFGEDYEWAFRIHEAKAFKTQALIPNYIYHYQYNPIK